MTEYVHVCKGRLQHIAANETYAMRTLCGQRWVATFTDPASKRPICKRCLAAVEDTP